MKKHWYDYLWIVSLTYLVLGFFNIMFAWLGLLCFFIPLIIAIAGGSKGVLQPLLRQRTALCAGRRQIRSFTQEESAEVSEKQMVPLRLPHFLLYDVLRDAMEHMDGL